MKQFLLSAIGFFLIALAQFSFINVLFPNIWIRPDVLVLLTLLWLLRREFAAAARFALLLGLAFDIVSSHTLGLTSLFLLWCVYSTSFLSRRFLVEHSEVGTITTGLLAGFFSWGMVWIDAVRTTWGAPHGMSLSTWFSGQRISDLLAGLLLNALLFILMLLFQRRFWRHSLVAVPTPISTRS